MSTTYETVMIDSKWVDKFLSPGWQRFLYNSNINYFVNQLRNNTFKDNQIITVKKSKKKDEFIVIDGQHRIEAIRVSGISAIVDLRIVDGLEEKELLEEYVVANTGKAPRLIDDIKLQAEGYKNKWILRFLNEQEFPINISLKGGVNSIRIDNFLNVVNNGFINSITRRNLSRKRLSAFLENISEEKYNLVVEFCEFFTRCYGEPFKDNWVYRNIVMATIMRFWLANKDSFEKEEMITIFKRIEGNKNISRDSLSVDRSIIEMMTRRIYRLINKKRTINKFVPFWDEE